MARQSLAAVSAFRAVMLAAVALLLAGEAASASKSLPGLTFNAPDGGEWKEMADSQSILFQQDFTNEGQKGAVLIVVGNKDGYTGELLAGFEETAKETALMVDQAPSREETGVTTTGLPMRWTFKCCDINGVGLHLTQVAIRHPKGLAYGFLAIIRPTMEIEEKASQLMEEIVASFDYGAGLRPKLPPVPQGSHPVTGLFTRVSSKFVLNVMGGMDLRTEAEALYLEPSGLYARQPPIQEGMCMVRSPLCGTYAVNGDTLTMDQVSEHFGLVTRKTVPFAVEGNQLKIDGNNWYAAAPSHSLTLKGSWTSLYFASGSSMYQGGTISIQKSFEFTPDGRFTRTGFAAVSSTNVIGDDVVSSSGSAEDPVSTGRYTIDGYALSLTGDDGKFDTLSIIVFDQNDLSVLLIDGDPYVQDK